MKISHICMLFIGICCFAINSLSFAQEAEQTKVNRAPMVVHDKNPYPSTYQA